MKVAGIIGSRRKSGNTAVLVEEALKPFRGAGEETELVYLSDYQITPCSGCEGCRKNYRCVVEDGMQKLYRLLTDSDAVILGSPTYFYNVTADVKAFLDRLYAFEIFDPEDRSVWMGINEALGGKYAAVIAVCEQANENDMGYTADTMTKTLQALGYRVVESVKTIGLYSKGEASGNRTELLKAEKAGRKLMKTMQLRNKLNSEFSSGFRY